MALPNPWTITLGAFEVGGASDTYLLNGPYVIERSAENLRLVFTVTVVATSYSELLSLSETLEASCSARDIGFVIDIDGEQQTFFTGGQLLNPIASVSKVGDFETDRGFSRDYTVSIEAGVPASDDGGLREISFTVSAMPSLRKVVTVRGLYTSTLGGGALSRYQDNADGKINPVLNTALGATWELIEEDYSQDRNDHNVEFTRVYNQIVYPESVNPNTPFLIDARYNFIRLWEAPGDSEEGVVRAGRVIARVDTWVSFNMEQLFQDQGEEIDNDDALQTVWTKICRRYMLEQFAANFAPQVFAVEDESVTLDRTDNRISATMQFFYQKDDGSPIMEVAASVAYQEQRQIDYTYVHAENDSFNELAAFADPGFIALFRTSSRTVRVFGEETPYLRLVKNEKEDGLAGPFSFVVAGKEVKKSGWNLIDSTSSVTPEYIGLPSPTGGNEEQVRVTTLSETVIERYNAAPQGTASGGSEPLEPPITPLGTGGPTTGTRTPGAGGNTGG